MNDDLKKLRRRLLRNEIAAAVLFVLFLTAAIFLVRAQRNALVELARRQADLVEAQNALVEALDKRSAGADGGEGMFEALGDLVDVPGAKLAGKLLDGMSKPRPAKAWIGVVVRGMEQGGGLRVDEVVAGSPAAGRDHRSGAPGRATEGDVHARRPDARGRCRPGPGA